MTRVCLSALVCSAAVILSGSCGPRTKPPAPGLCFVTAKPSPDADAVRSLWTEDWFDLLLKDFDRFSGLPKAPERLCVGKTIAWPDESACKQASPTPVLLDRESLEETDLVFEKLSETRRLVWAMVRRFDNGEAIGPVAVVDFTGGGAAVRAIGTLRAAAGQPELALERTGSSTVLLASGGLCPAGEDDPARCPRFTRAVPLYKKRFRSASLTTRAGRCLGSAWFPAEQETTVAVAGGKRRRYVLKSEVDVDTTGVIVSEVLEVTEWYQGSSEEPELVQRAEKRRRIAVDKGRLVPDGESLWSAVAAAGN